MTFFYSVYLYLDSTNPNILTKGNLILFLFFTKREPSNPEKLLKIAVQKRIWQNTTVVESSFSITVGVWLLSLSPLKVNSIIGFVLKGFEIFRKSSL